MGYIKVAYQKVLNYMDDYSVLPNGWDKFVNKQKKHHNLIIKSSNNRCLCTNCNHEFIHNKKVNEKIKCPNCHNKYLIKRSNIRNYEFKDYLSILDLIDDTFVVRYFELKTVMKENHKFCSSVVEFAREIPTRNTYREVFVNERVSKCQGCNYVIHSNYCNTQKWRLYTRNYSLIDYSIVFPNNIKELLKNTEYKYSQIWDIAKHCSYIDLPLLITNKSELPRLELLTKMKLYNLALRAGEFRMKGTFKELFGVSKDYYPFMKRNNITYTQLRLLQLLKEKDIKKIRYLEKFTGYNGNIYNLEEISKYISLSCFIKYAKMHHSNVEMDIYKDYLRFAYYLGLNLKNNKYAFPINLKEKHDELQKQYKIHSQKLINEAILKRAKILETKIYKDKKFIILPAKSIEDLVDESKQQSNCVRTYAEKYAEGSCDIYFMRDIKEQSKSLVTVEVIDNRVVQSRTKYNHDPNDKQLKFLKIWEENVLKGAA